MKYQSELALKTMFAIKTGFKIPVLHDIILTKLI